MNETLKDALIVLICLIVGAAIVTIFPLITYDMPNDGIDPTAAVTAVRTDGRVNVNVVSSQKVDGTSRIACGSDSMGMDFGCNDKVYWRHILNQGEIYEPGEIYIFDTPYYNDTTTIHRLVKDCREGCFGLIFKGDNNLVADPVINESDVLYKVVMVEYR